MFTKHALEMRNDNQLLMNVYMRGIRRLISQMYTPMLGVYLSLQNEESVSTFR